jgi:hypothetical protein
LTLNFIAMQKYYSWSRLATLEKYPDQFLGSKNLKN